MDLNVFQRNILLVKPYGNNVINIMYERVIIIDKDINHH